MAVTPPRLPDSPVEYGRDWMDKCLRTLRLYFELLSKDGTIRATTLNINVDSLPTDADLANLRIGDVYRDTTDSDALRIKT